MANPLPDTAAGLGARWLDMVPDGDNLGVEDLPSFHVVRLAGHFRRLTQKALEGEEIGYAEWRLLGLLGARSPISTPEVGRASLMDKAQISRAVDMLTRRSLIRQSGDPANARRRILELTPAGREVHARILRKTWQVQARLLRQLSPNERAAFGQVLERIAQLLVQDASSSVGATVEAGWDLAGERPDSSS